MNKKLLTTQILLALAVSASVCTTGMAAEMDSIGNNYAPGQMNEEITVTNEDVKRAAIKFDEDSSVDTINVALETGPDSHDITLTSVGSGIHTTDKKGKISLVSSADNTINFKEGKGIYIEDDTSVTLNAAAENRISRGEDALTGEEDYDGINAGGAGTISLTGANNTIDVQRGTGSDGIYTVAGSDKNVTLTATMGSNTLIAGNNGIDHRGNGTIELTADNGGNIIHAGNGQTELEGDGLRVSGNGNVNMLAQYNEITGHDEGIYVGTANSEIHITATGEKEGIGNLISGADKGIQLVGRNVTGGKTVTGGSTITITATQGSNAITAGHTGIAVNGDGNQIELSGDKNVIHVAGGTSSYSLDASGSAREYIYGITARENGSVSIKKEGKSDQVSQIIVENAHGAVRGLHANKGGKINIEQNALNISVHRIDGEHDGNSENNAKYVYGIVTNVDDMSSQVGNQADSEISVKTDKDMDLSVISDKDSSQATGVYAASGGQIKLESTEGAVSVHVEAASSVNSNSVFGLLGEKYGVLNVTAKNGIDIDAQNLSDTGAGYVYGVQVKVANTNPPVEMLDAGNVVLSTEGNLSVDAHAGITSTGIGVAAQSYTNAESGGEVRVDQAKDVNISASGKSAKALSASSKGKNIIHADGVVNLTAASIEGSTGGNIQAMYAFNGNNEVTTNQAINVTAQGFGTNENTVEGIHTLGNKTSTGNTKLTGSGITVTATNDDGKVYGIYAEGSGNSNTTLTAKVENNVIDSDGIGIFSTAVGTAVTLEAVNQNNLIYAGNQEEVTDADGTVTEFGRKEAIHAETGSVTTLNAANQNALMGAAFAQGTGTQVNLEADSNFVQSYAVIDKAGGLDKDESFAGKSVISALYAEGGAQVTVDGEQNVIRTYADNTNENQLERTVWAYDGADIHIDGTTLISTDRYATSPNSLDIAIAAGTAVGLDAVDVAAPVADRATVTLNYDGVSAITGDILSAYAGQVDIAAKEGSHAGLAVTGNILAGNNGVLNLDLGEGGVLNGRADDYGDANEEHTKFFNPAFSSTILSGGEVSLKIGNGALWNVTGQSWITNLTGEGGVVNMTGTEDASSHAVHIKNLSGNHTFVMDVNHANHTASDMLYVANTDENSVQTVQFTNMANLAGMANGEKLRFATVNAANTQLQFVSGDTGTARTYARDIGINDLGLDIRNEAYQTTDTENVGYNGESFGMDKAGNESINGQYGEGTNWYLVRNESADQTSDAGKTVIAMSKVNYSNAVYMDRLNKRMGEARYIDGDDGLWVRLRHDRIGKDDAFRSQNTMFELGYDWHAKGQQDGEHRQGVAFDYMRGTADYQNVMGDGDVRRAGVWLYDTWLGDKGHYSDYVVKYGRLSNDFDIYGRFSNGNKISGDYDNDVWSVSAEYGRKKDIGNDWYFEPQVQAQYAYVTSADYTTSQNTKVHLDGIDSLIGRAGFRLGRDTSEGNTVYFKADILHEFLGDQSIQATDITGTLDTTYENEGTWYDVGFGFSHRMGEDSYLFLDVEHSFGNDNDDTYQVNIGLNHAF